MMKWKRILTFLLALGFSLVLTGCKDAQKQKAIAEAKAAKAELAQVKAALEQAQNERNALRTDMTGISESLEKVKSELANVKRAPDKLQGQVNKLSTSRDAAVTEAKNARVRIVELQGELKVAQAAVADLQEKLKAVTVPPAQ